MGLPDKTSKEEETEISECEWEGKGRLWEGKGKRGSFWEGGAKERREGGRGKERERRESKLEGRNGKGGRSRWKGAKRFGVVVNRLWMDCG